MEHSLPLGGPVYRPRDPRATAYFGVVQQQIEIAKIRAEAARAKAEAELELPRLEAERDVAAVSGPTDSDPTA